MPQGKLDHKIFLGYNSDLTGMVCVKLVVETKFHHQENASKRISASIMAEYKPKRQCLGLKEVKNTKFNCCQDNCKSLIIPN